MINLLVIAVGGALGSVLRYTIQKAFPGSFPVGTLMINLAGCFFIGYLWTLALKGLNDTTRLFLMTGFCGGFTTFSAFGLESIQMLMADKWLPFSLYIITSVAGGLLATFLGYKIFS